MQFILAFLLIFISSCSVVVKTPSSRFMSPEAKGEFLNGDLAMSSTGYTKAKVQTNGATPGQKITTPLKLEQDYAPALNANLGITERIDIFVTGHDRSPFMTGFKFQIIIILFDFLSI